MFTTSKSLLTGVLLTFATVVIGCERPTEPHPVTDDLSGYSVAILITEGFQDEETLHPKEFLRERNAEVVVIGPAVETVTAYNSDQQVQIDKAVADVTVDEFSALVIPGGQSPGHLREIDEVVEFVADFYETGRPIAAICHGPQLLIAAGIMEGKRATCFEGMSDELIEAGAHYEDSPVVRDENIITSRIPDDLPMFSAAIAVALVDHVEPLDATTPYYAPPTAPPAPMLPPPDAAEPPQPEQND